VNTTYNQVNGFLDQWKTYVTHNYSDYEINITTQLEALCLIIDKINDDMNNDDNNNNNYDNNMIIILKEIENNTILITNDMNSMIINYKNEDKIIKNNIKILQSKILNDCHKQIEMLKDNHHISSKQQGNKLMKALKGM